MAPFVLSIELTNGTVYRHPFHLGTIEGVARQLAEEKFHAHPGVAKARTVALLRDGRLFDVFDGRWSSDDDGWA